MGCLGEEGGELFVSDSCEKRVFGLFKPAALITNIAVIAGVLSATIMPVGECLEKILLISASELIGYEDCIVSYSNSYLFAP